MPRSFFHWLETKRRHTQPRVNPFEKKVKTPSRWIGRGVAVLSVCVLCLLIFAALRSKHLLFSGVQVRNTVFVSSEEVKQMVETSLAGEWGRIVPRAHRWFLGAHNVEERLKNTFPVTEIELVREGDELVVVVHEEEPAFLLEMGDRLAMCSRTGALLREVTTAEQELLSAPAEGSSTPPERRIDILRHSIRVRVKGEGEFPTLPNLAQVERFWRLLEERGLQPQELSYDKPSRFLLGLSNGSVLIPSLELDPERQLEHVLKVMEDRQKRSEAVSQIDLRYDQRIYVR